MRIYKNLFYIILVTMIIGCVNNTNQSQSEASYIGDRNIQNIDIYAKIYNDNIKVFWDMKPNVVLYTLKYGDIDNGLYESVKLDANKSNYSLKDIDIDTIYTFKLFVLLTDGTTIKSNTLQVKSPTVVIDKRQFDEGPSSDI